MMTVVMHVVREAAVRTWIKTLRRPVPLTFSFVQPLFWMLIFGFLFQRFSLGPEYAGLSYVDFLVPGICTMTVLFGASQAGIMLVRDIQTGFLQRMAQACVQPGWMLAGKLAADTVRLLLQALFVATMGILVGARPHPGVLGLGIAVAGLTCFAFGYASLSCWIALKSRAQESLAVFIHVVNMPLLFTSTALVPSKQMPDWLEVVAQWNPLTLVSNGLRSALLFDQTPGLWTILLPMLAGSLALFTLARVAMKSAHSAQ